MDPITHAASGAVAMLALPRRPLTRWAVPLAALAAASPDLDLIFASTPLQFLLLHRGITHSLAAMPALAVRHAGTLEFRQGLAADLRHDIAAHLAGCGDHLRHHDFSALLA